MSERLDRVGNVRFLLGEPRFIATLDPEKTDKKAFKIEDEGLELANRLQQKEIARRCAQWISNKVEIRSIRQANLLHGKLYHIHDGHREHATLGSSNFTRRGLGLARVLNPAAHGTTTPLYDAEVQQAKRLIDRLEKLLDTHIGGTT